MPAAFPFNIHLMVRSQVAKGMRSAARSVQAASAKMRAGFKRVSDVVFGLKSGIVALIAALGARDLVQSFAEQDRAVQGLANSLKIAGEFTQEAQADFERFASELQKVSVVGDETSLRLLAIAKSMRLTNDQAKKLVEASVDLSAATGKNLEESFRQLLKTFGGYAGELGEVFPALKEFTAEQMKAGAAVDAVAAQFAGFGKGQLATFSGRMAQIANQFGDLKEQAGRFIAAVVDSGLGDFIQTTLAVFTDKLKAIADDFKGGGTQAKSFADAAVAGLKAVGFVVAGVVDGISLLRAGFRELQIIAIDSMGTMLRTMKGMSGIFKVIIPDVANFHDQIDGASAVYGKLADASKRVKAELEADRDAARNTGTAMEAFVGIMKEVEARLDDMSTAAARARAESADPFTFKIDMDTSLFDDPEGFTQMMAEHEAAIRRVQDEFDELGKRQAVLTALKDGVEQMGDAILNVAENALDQTLDAAFAGQIRNAEDLGRIARDMLEEIAKQLIKIAIIQGVKAVAGAFTGGGGAVIPAARGAVFPGPLTPFAAGGVATRPVAAHIAEAGIPEAVIPMPSGKVPVELTGGGGDTIIVNNHLSGLDGPSIARVAQSREFKDSVISAVIEGKNKSLRVSRELGR